MNAYLLSLLSPILGPPAYGMRPISGLDHLTSINTVRRSLRDMLTGQLPSLLVPDCVTVAEQASTDSSQNFTDSCCNILQAYVACTQ